MPRASPGRARPPDREPVRAQQQQGQRACRRQRYPRPRAQPEPLAVGDRPAPDRSGDPSAESGASRSAAGEADGSARGETGDVESDSDGARDIDPEAAGTPLRGALGGEIRLGGTDTILAEHSGNDEDMPMTECSTTAPATVSASLPATSTPQP